MFRCDFCGKNSLVGERRTIIITERKWVEFPHRVGANRLRKEGLVDYTPDMGGNGPQIKTEQQACPRCAEIRKDVPAIRKEIPKEVPKPFAA
jgi:hypothetical protein